VRVFALLFAFAFSAVNAQTFPSKTVRLVSGVTPGSASDTMARILAEKMTVTLGVPVIVENRLGAGGLVGAKYVAAAEPDGHTIMMYASAFTVSTLLNPGLDPKELQPVATVATVPTVLVTSPEKGYRTIGDFRRRGESPAGQAGLHHRRRRQRHAHASGALPLFRGRRVPERSHERRLGGAHRGAHGKGGVLFRAHFPGAEAHRSRQAGGARPRLAPPQRPDAERGHHRGARLSQLGLQLLGRRAGRGENPARDRRAPATARSTASCSPPR